MSCNHCSIASGAPAAAAGAPEIEAAWAGNRGAGQQCPTCGQFMSPKGGHVCPPPLSMADIQARVQNVSAAKRTLAAEFYDLPVPDRHLAAAIDAMERVPELVEAAYRAGHAASTPPPALDTHPVQWRRPSWAGKRRSPEELAQISDEQMSQWRQEDAECEAHNRAEKKRREGQRQQARQLLEAIYGKGSRQVKYFDKEVPAYGPAHSFVLEIENPVKEARKKQEALNKAAQREAEAKRLTQEAANWLLERGRKLGPDFAYEDALETANDIAFYEEVARREEAGKNGQWYRFDGDNNCEGEDCAGWDGHSHRCQCGSRRVSWQMGDGHSFKNLQIYAEAY